MEIQVIIGCEESGIVTAEFRKLGIEAYSCDILPTSGNHPEWHIQGDVLQVISEHPEIKMLIAFPPCTFLSHAGNGYFDIKKYGEKAIQRHKDRVDAVTFFMKLYNADIEKICVENPVGHLNSKLPPSQIIEPYFFGDRHKKRTCLWLKGLPKLVSIKQDDLFATKTYSNIPKPTYIDKISGKKRYFTDSISGKYKEGKKMRSVTFQGIARAMAEQWGKLLKKRLLISP